MFPSPCDPSFMAPPLTLRCTKPQELEFSLDLESDHFSPAYLSAHFLSLEYQTASYLALEPIWLPPSILSTNILFWWNLNCITFAAILQRLSISLCEKNKLFIMVCKAHYQHPHLPITSDLAALYSLTWLSVGKHLHHDKLLSVLSPTLPISLTPYNVLFMTS